MSKKQRYLVLILVALVVGAFIGYQTVFNAKHRNIVEEEVSFFLSASDLQTPFFENNEEVSSTYIDQVVQVSGKVTDVSADALELDAKVQVNLLDSLTVNISNGASVTIKGRCVGYDDLLEVVRVDQSTLIE